jgi:hypothetical protein
MSGHWLPRRQIVLAGIFLAPLLGGPPEVLAQADPWHATLSQPESVAQMRQQAGRTAHVLQSEHFVLVYTTREAQARDLAQRLESVYQAHRRFVADLHLSTHAPAHKLEVLFFATCDEFKRHLAAIGDPRADLLGGYEPAANRTVFFDFDTYPPLAEIQAAVERAAPAEREKLRARLRRRREALCHSVIRHEAAHQVQVNLGVLPALDRVPNWLAEGLAMLFEATRPAADTRLPLNSYRLFEFRKLYGAGRPTLGAVRRLLADEDGWCGGECYPLAWAVVRLLYEERPAALAKLLHQAADGGLPVAAAERGALIDELLGPVNESWVDQLYTTTMGLPLDPSTRGDRDGEAPAEPSGRGSAGASPSRPGVQQAGAAQ